MPKRASAPEQKLTDFEVSGLFALFLPTPTAVIQKPHDATVVTINTPAVAAKRNELGAMIDSLERRRQTIYTNMSSRRSVERSRQPNVRGGSDFDFLVLMMLTVKAGKP